MKPKFQLSVEQNVFLAKRNIVDYIWKSAKMEGLKITYPETQSIYNGMTVHGVAVPDILIVINLKQAWQFVLEHLDYPFDLPLISKINHCVGNNNIVWNAGHVRKTPIVFGGTSWKPEIPDEEQIKVKLTEIHKMENPTERAITLMLVLMRTQMFTDGNKRTAMLAANHALIASGGGIISVPVEQHTAFFELLIQYYETNEMGKIKQFVYDHCIDGMEFEPVQEVKFDFQKRKNDRRE
ncbi:MAG: Fic family protein [Paenibacillaceae bacterium]|nr:Fic family protein [Paenibacillaceae bacterium]